MIKILAVDDSPTDLANIKKIVEESGVMVYTAASGKEALTQATANKPDLIFLDIIMPEMDGYETCRRLANNNTTKDIPVVFVTSKNQKADRLWAQMQGAKGYISKPYSPDQIIDQIMALS
jgi:twitching motility two-component system response regulator PilH